MHVSPDQLSIFLSVVVVIGLGWGHIENWWRWVCHHFGKDEDTHES